MEEAKEDLMKGKGGNVVVGVLLARVKSWMGAKKVVEEAMEDILSGLIKVRLD